MDCKQDICPHCGGTETVAAKQTGQGSVVSKEALTLISGQPLFHVVCLNCGTVIRSYVKYPKHLR